MCLTDTWGYKRMAAKGQCSAREAHGLLSCPGTLALLPGGSENLAARANVMHEKHTVSSGEYELY